MATATAQRNDIRLQKLAPFGVTLTHMRPSAVLQDLSTSYLEELVAEHGLLQIRGLPNVSGPALEAFCRRIGTLLRWPFGYVLDLKVQEDATNYLFTRDVVPLHWDGVFAEADPHYLFFQCLAAPLAGGESVFSDTATLWENLSERERDWLSKLVCRYQQKRTAHYGGDVARNVVAQHPITRAFTLRYTEPVSGIGGNAPELVGGTEAENAELAAFMARELYRPDNCLVLPWTSGDFVMFDNHRLLHGRKAFGASSERHLQRVHIL